MKKLVSLIRVLTFNQVQSSVAAWYFLSRLTYKKAAAIQKPCLNQTGGIKNKKEVISDLFFELAPPIRFEPNDFP